MKKAIIALAVVLVLGTVGVAIYAKNSQYQTQKQHEAAKAELATQAQVKAIADVKSTAAKTQNDLTIKLDRVTVNCQKGLGAYALLTPAQKVKVGPGPVCQ